MSSWQLNFFVITPFIFLAFVTTFYSLSLRKEKIKYQKKEKCLNSEAKRKTEEIERKIYEISILRELGERIGYSLNLEEIVSIICSTLRKLIDYSTASYMIIRQKEILFHCEIENPVSRKFIEEVKERMLKSLSALSEKEFSKKDTKEMLTGTILDESKKELVNSFFNIPLIISDQIVGILTVASTKKGLYKEEEMTVLYQIVAQASRTVTRLNNLLEREKGKLNTMVESIADGVIMVDRQSIIQVINPAAKKLLKLEGKEEINIFDLIGVLENSIDLRKELEECLQKEKLVITDELYIQGKVIKMLISPVKTKLELTGKPETTGTVILFQDITKVKELEQIRKDFTTVMVHELRSPLTAARGATDILLCEGEKLSKKENKELLNQIFTSASSMLTLINDLLDVSKIEAGKFQIVKGENDLKDLVETKIKEFRPLAQQKNISLTTDMIAEIPKFNFDKQRIGQVLNNLISNSLKFTDSEGEIKIQLESKEKKVLTSVTDTGQGIPKEKREELFSRFKQFTFQKGENKGTGLGLFIAKGIIEAHQGKIWIESKEGKGTTVYFTLPI